MKAFKTLFCLGAMFVLTTATAQADNVYICTGHSATKYHKVTNCRGLNSCSGEVKAVTEATAKNNGREKCLICYAANYGQAKKATTSATKVFVTPSGTKYHKDKACTLIAKSKNVQELTLTAAKEKYEPCSKCAADKPAAEKKADKTAADKKADKPAAEKKTADKKGTASSGSAAGSTKKADTKPAAEQKATGTSKVYVAANGSKYHKKKSCTALAKSKDIKTITLAEAKTNMTPCSVCYTSAKKPADKPAAEKKADKTADKSTTKAADKKADKPAAEKKAANKKGTASSGSAAGSTKKADTKPAAEAPAAEQKATGTSKVYVAAGGTKYHKKKSCTALAKSKDIKSITLGEAKEKMTPCSVCYTSAKKTADKPAAEKKADKPAAEKKAAEKKGSVSSGSAAGSTKKADTKKATEKKTTTRKAA